MKTVDFGENIFQFEIQFKISCISGDTVLAAATQLTYQGKPFPLLGKDPQTNESGLTKGAGTPEDPIRQVKLAGDHITIWAGWHTPYDTWRSWRNEILQQVANLRSIPVGTVLSLGARAAMVVPNEHCKRAEDIPELAPIIAFSRRYVPKELHQRSAGRSLFTDALNTKSIETWLQGTPDGKKTSFGHLFRSAQMNQALTLAQNFSAFAIEADSAFEAFYSLAVRPLIKTEA